VSVKQNTKKKSIPSATLIVSPATV